MLNFYRPRINQLVYKRTGEIPQLTARTPSNVYVAPGEWPYAALMIGLYLIPDLPVAVALNGAGSGMAWQVLDDMEIDPMVATVVAVALNGAGSGMAWQVLDDMEIDPMVATVVSVSLQSN